MGQCVCIAKKKTIIDKLSYRQLILCLLTAQVIAGVLFVDPQTSNLGMVLIGPNIPLILDSDVFVYLMGKRFDTVMLRKINVIYNRLVSHRQVQRPYVWHKNYVSYTIRVPVLPIAWIPNIVIRLLRTKLNT